MKRVGLILLAIGLIGLIATLGMDTTHHGVHNIGLLNDKQNYLLVSLAMAIVGAVVMVINRSKTPTNPTEYGATDGRAPNSGADQNQQKGVQIFEGERNLSIPKYQLFLTKRFSIEKNTTLDKFILREDVFDTLEMALQAADQRYSDELSQQEEKGRTENQPKEPRNDFAKFWSKCAAIVGITGTGQKSKPLAIILALTLGIFGGHKFYMGSWGWGIVQIILCLTGSKALLEISILIALVDLIRMAMMSQAQFATKASAFKGKGPFAYFW